MLFECVVGKCFVVLYVFSFPPALYVGTFNLIASIPGPSILTFEVYIPCCNFIDSLFVASITGSSNVFNRQCLFHLLTMYMCVQSFIYPFDIQK